MVPRVPDRCIPHRQEGPSAPATQGHVRRHFQGRSRRFLRAPHDAPRHTERQPVLRGGRR
eukprot:3038573-Alexandrium_andersonii.AAC.1